MTKLKTYFEQIPVEIVEKIAKPEADLEVTARKKSKRKVQRGFRRASSTKGFGQS
jgi:hypothetical protein